MSFALGVLGLALDDFDRLTPSEFNAVAEAYYKHEEQRERGAWERMRIHMCFLLQPHTRRRLTPRALLPLPWDNDTDSAAPAAPPETRAEASARLKRLLRWKRKHDET